jgi:carbohydrate-selective porin OprB
MLCRELQPATGRVSRELRSLGPRLRTKYRLTGAVSIWAAFLIAAVSSVFAQDVQPSVGHPLTTFQTNEDPKANQPESGIFQSLQQRKYLFGDWKGERSTLAEKGITFDFYYMDDALANPYGGREDAGLWGRIRGSADVDFSKLTSWQGLTFHITGLWQYGTDLSTQYTGTLVNSSSLPSAHTLRLDSYFLQQYLLHHKIAIRLGQIAAYDSYGSSEYGASFVNLALGYAHSNLNQAVTFSFNPAGVPSFEVKVLPTNHLYVKAMVESQERNPYTTDPTGFAFHLGGPVLSTEIGYLKDPRAQGQTTTMGADPFTTVGDSGNHPGVYKFGAGYNPHNFFDPLTNVSRPGNYLLYGQIAQAVYRMGDVGQDRNRGLDLIYGEDWAPGDVTQYNHQIMTGGRWVGVFGGSRSKDTLALGYVWTAVGSHYRESQDLAGNKNLTHEHLVELNYMANVTRSLSFQPVFQWYVQPGGDASRRTVFVTGFRAKLTF